VFSKIRLNLYNLPLSGGNGIMESRGNLRPFSKDIIDIVIKISALGILVVWTFQLIKPFLIPVIWGMILAVATEPFIAWVSKKMGGRRSLAAILFVLMIIAALIIPAVLLGMSSVGTVQVLAEQMQNKALVIPPPPATVIDWPVVGKPLHNAWELASTNLGAALKQFAPQIKTTLGTVLSSVGGGLFGIFMAVISTCIAGVLLAKSEKSSGIAGKIITRLAGERGSEITGLAVGTIRGVMQGVVGVAVIQAILAAIGMIAAGVPAAGLWAVLTLICAVGQLPPRLILGPVAAYVFSVSNTTPAVIFLVWVIFIMAIDGFLKPMLMGRGVDVPMIVIMIGALGGMMLSGIIGLFVGAVVVAIMYTLSMVWLDEM
jgi:predicted PurR-regulated permease PerM